MRNISFFIPGFVVALPAALLAGCTGQLPSSYSLQEATESFSALTSQQVNTKVDILWVVDNSGSMDVSQQTLRQGFASFAQTYMKPTWDIRSAVITTDTYLANPAFSTYLNTAISGSVGYQSDYINGYSETYGSVDVPGRVGAFVNPSWAPTLLSSGSNPKFTNGVKNNQEHPQWGPNWAKLVPKNHDGPTTTLCWEGQDLFLESFSSCYIRDANNAPTGPANCASPGTGQSSMSQCVNTVENDTVHSGLPIISTIPPVGVSPDAAWTASLVNNFTVNLSTGSSGSGRERGLASVAQFMHDNEAAGSTTKFFRANALRVIVFVSDEDDQSMSYPSTVPSNFTPDTNYVNCAPKTVDGYTYTVGELCPATAQLIPTSTYKTQFDAFFENLDGTQNPNYFVAPIVLISGAAIQAIHQQRIDEDNTIGETNVIISDQGTRYIEFAGLVGNGSQAMEFGSTDYSPLLASIGNTLVSQLSTFTLARAPTSAEQMIVTVVHANGTSVTLQPSQYTLSGKTLTITDQAFVLNLVSTDKFQVIYEPSTVY